MEDKTSEESMDLEAKLLQGSDYNFIQEKIKDRPVNKKKLVRKMLLTVSFAIIFGLVACFTFIMLEPVFSKMVDQDDEIILEHVELSEEVSDDSEDITVFVSDQPIDDASYEETPIADMSLTDEDMPSIIGTPAVSGNQVTIIDKQELGLEDYRLLYRQLYVLSLEVNKSMVTLYEKPSISETGEINMYSDSASGLIIGDNGYEILVLADSTRINGVENISAKFCNDDTVDATIKMMDPETKLAIYAIKMSDIKSTTASEYTYATLGSSLSTTLNGSPVIAVGNPMNYGTSVCFGAITSTDNILQKIDASYQLLTTDIYADEAAQGFLINVRGQIVGVITADGHPGGLQNLAYAYGISSVKSLIEDMANDVGSSYVGVYVMDVTEEAKANLGVPMGAYVTRVANNSPAMNVGIVAGDVIVGVGDISINNVNVYTQCLRNYPPDTELTISVMRYSAGEYKEISLNIVTGEHEN